MKYLDRDGLGKHVREKSFVRLQRMHLKISKEVIINKSFEEHSWHVDKYVDIRY